jgi:site-specific recombinase XerD
METEAVETGTLTIVNSSVRTREYLTKAMWAKMPFPVHPHMLRHGCGYALANAGHDTRSLQAWLGHKNIQHTVRYTELAPDRFKGFRRD